MVASCVAADRVTVCADVYIPGAGENEGAAVVTFVGGVVAAMLLWALQPVKRRGSRRQGTVWNRFRRVVKKEGFRVVRERYFTDAPQLNRPSARLHVWHF
jgi:hypothetical protein